MWRARTAQLRMQSADRAHQAAQLAAKDAEIAYLLAMLDASQAQNELLSSESDRTDALIDELFDLRLIPSLSARFVVAFRTLAKKNFGRCTLGSLVYL